MFSHQDAFKVLDSVLPLKEKISHLHAILNVKYPFIARIAIAIYDPDTKILKTYIHSSGDDSPLDHYQALLENASSLREILKQQRPRVVNNMVAFKDGKNEHTKRITQQGYAASYTLPLYHHEQFFGFLFFNSYQKNVFNDDVLNELDMYAHLLSLLVINELSNIQMMNAAIKTTIGMTSLRDPETGSHLDRMSHFSRVIAKCLAEKYRLDDDYIEHLFMFSPLHDIGKIAIPDNILLKPGKLTANEKEIMKTHPQKGLEIIDNIIANFKLDGLENIDLLRNIAQYHHEAVNGSGYPNGMSQNNIPLEARIVAVSDVFDALTSKRPYKEAWSNERAISTLLNLADEQLDKDCVQALIENLSEIEKIQNLFTENDLA